MEPKLFVCFAKLGKLYLGRLFDFFAQTQVMSELWRRYGCTLFVDQLHQSDTEVLALCTEWATLLSSIAPLGEPNAECSVRKTFLDQTGACRETSWGGF